MILFAVKNIFLSALGSQNNNKMLDISQLDVQKKLVLNVYH